MLNDLISRTRRNHGLEHATIHVLSEKYKNFSAQGNSTHQGFFLNIYGDLPEEAVTEAVEEAYKRMKAGEEHLAVHPNCGTVLLTTATMVVLASQAALLVEQKRFKRIDSSLSMLINGLPSAVMAGVLALIVSRPVGLAIQEKYTTEGNLGDLRITRIRRIKPSLVTRFFHVLLAAGRNLDMKAYQIETNG